MTATEIAKILIETMNQEVAENSKMRGFYSFSHTATDVAFDCGFIYGQKAMMEFVVKELDKILDGKGEQ